MSKFVDIVASDRGNLGPLFGGHAHLRAVIESVLEGRLGTASADQSAAPRTGRLVLGVYTFLAGDAGTDAASEFVTRQAAPCEFIVAGEPNWDSLIDRVYGKRIERRTMDAFSPDSLDTNHLRALTQGAPDGVKITPMTAELARQLGPEFEPNRVSIFGSPEAFIERGLGECALEAGSIVSASSSYAVSSARVEVAIATHRDHRRRGLALAVGAAMLIRCLERDLEPHWTAGNPVSSKVAERLGFTFSGHIPVLYLRA